MRQYPDAQPAIDLPNSTRSPWIVVVSALVVAGLFLGQPLLLLAGLLLLGLSIFPRIWHYFAHSGLAVQRTLGAHRALLGEEIVLTLQVENRKFLPVPRVDIEDDVPKDGLAIQGTVLEISERATRALLANTFSLGTLQRISRRYRVRCLTRGVYTFGPLRLVSSDPFGLLVRERVLAGHTELLVYPLTVPLDWLGLVPRDLFGTHHAVRLLEDPLYSVGVREYVPGDDPRRVHWQATARLGRLQSKVYESATRRTLALFLDARTSAHPALTGFDAPLLELMVCAAASVASWATQQGGAVGLYANGVLVENENTRPMLAAGAHKHPSTMLARTQTPMRSLHRSNYIHITPNTGTRQVVHVQEALARFVPFFTADLAEMLLCDATRLPAGAAIVVISTPYGLDAASIAALHHLRKSGHPVAVLLAGSSQATCDATSTENAHQCDTNGADESSPTGLPTALLGDASTWTTLLGEALAVRTEKRRVDESRSLDDGSIASSGNDGNDGNDEDDRSAGEHLAAEGRKETRTAPSSWRWEVYP